MPTSHPPLLTTPPLLVSAGHKDPFTDQFDIGFFYIPDRPGSARSVSLTLNSQTFGYSAGDVRVLENTDVGTLVSVTVADDLDPLSYYTYTLMLPLILLIRGADLNTTVTLIKTYHKWHTLSTGPGTFNEFEFITLDAFVQGQI